MSNILKFYKCMFCNKNQNEVKQIIVDKDFNCICNECVELCYKIIKEQGEKEE